MVIIGSDPSQLDALKATLLGMLASPEPIPALPAQPSAQRAMVPAAEELKELVDGHERFEVVHALCSDGKTYWQQKLRVQTASVVMCLQETILLLYLCVYLKCFFLFLRFVFQRLLDVVYPSERNLPLHCVCIMTWLNRT
jgi:hypothetical protein